MWEQNDSSLSCDCKTPFVPTGQSCSPCGGDFLGASSGNGNHLHHSNHIASTLARKASLLQVDIPLPVGISHPSSLLRKDTDLDNNGEAPASTKAKKANGHNGNV